MWVTWEMLEYILLLWKEGIYFVSVTITDFWTILLFKIVFCCFFFFFILLVLACWRGCVFKTISAWVPTAMTITWAARQVLLFVINLYLILLTNVVGWLNRNFFVIFFLIFFLFAIASVPPTGKAVEPSKVVIVSVVTTWSDVLRLLYLKSQRPRNALKVYVLWLSITNEFFSHYHLRFKVFLLCQQIVFSFDQLVQLFLHGVLSVLELDQGL